MTEKEPRFRRPSPAFVVAMIALFVALTSAAVALPGKNTVNSGDVVNNSLKSVDLKDGKGVRSQDVVDGSLTGADVADGSLAGADVQDNSLGGAQIDESTLGQVPQADQANNLGGLPASSYQRSCQPGANFAHVYVKGSATFSSTYTGSATALLDQFNCTGNATKVQVKRTGAGTYFVDFPGIDPAAQIVATGNVTVDAAGNQDNNDMVTYKLVFDATLGRTIYRVETADGGGTLQDREFSFSVDG